MSHVNKTKTEALKEIMDTVSSGMSSVKETVTKALQGIKDTTSTGLTDLNKTKTGVLKEIKDTTSEVNKTKTEALKEIKDTTSCGLHEFEGLKSNLLEIKEQQTLIVTPAGRQPLTSTTLSELQDDLISFYRRQHSKITLSPLLEEDTPLLEFYVMPDLKSVEVKSARGGGEVEKTTISPFRNVFYKKDELYNEIYLTADAGFGKTAFSKRLTLTWCHAKKPLTSESKHFSKEEIEAMNAFRFVFLLLLRNSSNECDIDNMIMS